MSVLVILINMLTDLLARLIDPRIAASARAA
jgi:peptide/nickel transport system permease protein